MASEFRPMDTARRLHRELVQRDVDGTRIGAYAGPATPYADALALVTKGTMPHVGAPHPSPEAALYASMPWYAYRPGLNQGVKDWTPVTAETVYERPVDTRRRRAHIAERLAAEGIETAVVPERTDPIGVVTIVRCTVCGWQAASASEY